jgi:hypothetical protein
LIVATTIQSNPESLKLLTVADLRPRHTFAHTLNTFRGGIAPTHERPEHKAPNNRPPGARAATPDACAQLERPARRRVMLLFEAGREDAPSVCQSDFTGYP